MENAALSLLLYEYDIYWRASSYICVRDEKKLFRFGFKEVNGVMKEGT